MKRHRRGSAGTQGAKTFQTGLLECPLSLLRPSAQGELVPDELPVVAIDHGGEMGPAVVRWINSLLLGDFWRE